MNRFYGVIVAAVGLLITILSALKILPILGVGSGLIFLGLLLFGLSFVPRPQNEEETRKMPAAETLTKIFYAPAEVFQNLRQHPRWFAAILIVTILSSIYLNAFYYRLSPERVNNFTVDKVAESGYVPPDKVGELRVESLKQFTDPVRRVGSVVSGFVAQVFMSAFLGALFFVIILALGGKINFWQAFSAAVYAMFPVTIINYLLSLIILFLKDPVEIHPLIGQGTLVTDNLGALITSSQSPVLFVLLSGFGLLAFYRLWLNATGLKNAGERVTPTMAWTAAGIIFVCGILLGVVSALLFGKFMS